MLAMASAPHGYFIQMAHGLAPPPTATSPPVIHQAGPRRLWNDLDSLRERWLRDGSLPAYGSTVAITPDGTITFTRGRWQAILPAGT